MTRQEFLVKLDEVMQLPAGTLQGPENLEALAAWDSIAVMGYIALVSSGLKKRVSGKDVISCRTVDELTSLAGLSQ